VWSWHHLLTEDAGCDGKLICAKLADKPESLPGAIGGHFNLSRPVVRIVRKNFVQVLPSIQHARYFSHIILDPIKYNVRPRNDGAQSGPYLVSRSTREWMVFEYAAGLADITNDLFRRVLARYPEIIAPNFGKIGMRVR
jgi:hypothetical protein